MRKPRRGECVCEECCAVRRLGDGHYRLWRMLDESDTIQPGDHYGSSLDGRLYRCTPEMMGKQIPYYAMPHLRPAGMVSP